MQEAATLYFRFPGLDTVTCAFTTRLSPIPGENGGCGNIALNGSESADTVLARREALRSRLGYTALSEVRQVHGTNMIFDPEDAETAQSEPAQADALATGQSGRALMIKTADCQPVLLAHQSGLFVAALHVGWRANRAGAPVLWTEAFCRRYGLRPKDLLAVRGPSLGPGRSEFVNFETEWGPDFAAYFDHESRCLDLWQLTKDQLVQAGLQAERIFALDLCTYSLPELFFSHRRDRGRGRQAGLIWIH